MNKILKSFDLYQVDWALQKDVVHYAPKHLYLWLRKSLLYIYGTSRQLHRQKSCDSSAYRFCLFEPELGTFHVFECQHELLVRFKRTFFSALTRCTRTNRRNFNSFSAIGSYPLNRIFFYFQQFLHASSWIWRYLPWSAY